MSTPTPRKEIRQAIVRFPQELLLLIMEKGMMKRPNQSHMIVPKFPELPPDAEVIAVREDFASRSIAVLIESKEFAPVEPGAHLPILPTVLDTHVIDLRKADPEKLREALRLGLEPLKDEITPVAGKVTHAKDVIDAAIERIMRKFE